LVFAEVRKVGGKVAPQDVGSRFSNLHAAERWSGNVFAAVLGVGFGNQQALAGQQLDLAADAGLGLTEAIGDAFLLDARIPLQHHQDAILAQANTQLFLQSLIGLFAHDSRQVLQKIAEIITRAHAISLSLNT